MPSAINKSQILQNLVDCVIHRIFFNKINANFTGFQNNLDYFAKA